LALSIVFGLLAWHGIVVLPYKKLGNGVKLVF